VYSAGPSRSVFRSERWQGSPDHGFSANVASNSIPLISKFTFAETLYAKLVIAVADSAWPRRQIGVVLQENILMNHLVRENIALAGSGMPLDRVVEAAKLAGDHEFILGNLRALATFVKGGR
jgi:hypothetical protein